LKFALTHAVLHIPISLLVFTVFSVDATVVQLLLCSSVASVFSALRFQLSVPAALRSSLAAAVAGHGYCCCPLSVAGNLCLS